MSPTTSNKRKRDSEAPAPPQEVANDNAEANLDGETSDQSDDKMDGGQGGSGAETPNGTKLTLEERKLKMDQLRKKLVSAVLFTPGELFTTFISGCINKSQSGITGGGECKGEDHSTGCLSA